MTNLYEYGVIGCGLVGSAAAKYLAQTGAKVAVLGPQIGPQSSPLKLFNSHDDQTRIFRTLDDDAQWAEWAKASVGRYQLIEAESGISFASKGSCLVVRDHPRNFDKMDTIARENQSKYHRVGEHDLLQLLDGVTANAICPLEARLENESAGILNPRQMLKAQQALARRYGADFIDAISMGLSSQAGSIDLVTDAGKFHFKKVLYCLGPYSPFSPILPPAKVLGRTLTLFEIPPSLLERFRLSYPVIFQAKGFDVYVVPPTKYPDGKFYLKVGGDPDDFELETLNDVSNWFHSAGRPSASKFHQEALEQIYPALKFTSVSTQPCAVSQTATGKPFLGRGSVEHTWGFTGCSGSAAKSSDEIGRLAASMISDQ
ncbi:NAD(P)/FAD-dependent oxidoreductase [Agrobacterium tumefaciens]|uniref:NAD(P)/FAD-dependent oxidoreductase n=1 Tax=Agrobacterium tumefaciens TaxID=358 RepID=UPI0015724B75|nr:FAD-binding oxidoreductase [Agrobacterium tumefaciens]